MEGKLYIVATPIGNLEDITYRAVKVLNGVDLIAAEDTRHTLKLLNHLEISKPLMSYYKETEKVKAKVIIDKLNEVKNIQSTLIFYEAPHKIDETLKCMIDILGDRKISIGREMTKIHEEFIRGKISEVMEKIEPKGEMVIIVEGAEKSESDIARDSRNEMTLEEHYAYYEGQGLEKKEIIKRIAKDRGVNKNEIYKHFI